MATNEDKIAMLDQEVESLHSTLQRMGKNSKNVTDVFGRPFVVPVSNEHKATCALLPSIGRPLAPLRTPLSKVYSHVTL